MKIRKFLPFFLLIVSCLSCSDSSKNHEPKQEIKIIEKVNALSLPPIPDKMEFCGEEINLLDMDVRERLDRELIANAYFHSATLLYLKRANRVFPVIEQLLKKENMPMDLKYLAVAESGLANVSSPAGAKGIWQFMSETAEEYDLTVNELVDERYHLEKSTLAACKYLVNSRSKFENWSLALASYNRGIGGVHQDMEWQNTDNYFDAQMNNETGRYVFRMMALKLIMENPEAYGFQLKDVELYAPYETKIIEVKEGIKDLATWAQEHGCNYKIVKLLNPWILKNSLPKDTFRIQLPQPTMNLKPMEAYKK